MNQLRQVAPFLHFGWVVSLSLGAGAIVGSRLDTRFDTKPLFLLLGIGLGLSVSAWQFYRMVRSLEQKPKSDE